MAVPNIKLPHSCWIIRLMLMHVILMSFSARGQVPDPSRVPASDKITKVYVVFKTHLDLGFTDLGSEVERKYIEDFFPAAMDVAEQIREESGGKERFIWTTGSWLIDMFLQKAQPSEKERLIRAIERGDIAWNAMPFTTESEVLSREVFEGMVGLSQQLDRRFDKQTTGAKLTDVPGHTRGIISPLREAGIRFLHVGINKSSTVPSLPEICRWQHPDGSWVILVSKWAYGNQVVFPDSTTVLSIHMVNDNNGAHTLKRVRDDYRKLREQFPNAELVAATLSDVADELMKYEDTLPVVTGEIGDTWIHGYASSPNRMARFRALQRLYREWIGSGAIAPKSDQAIAFCVELGMVGEHTWGVDIGKFLKHEDKYDFDAFQAARSLQDFRFVEESWREIDLYIDRAIALLPAHLRKEAFDALAEADRIPEYRSGIGKHPEEIGRHGELISFHGKEVSLGLFSFQTLSSKGLSRFTDNVFLRHGPKSGMAHSQAVDLLLQPELESCVTSKTKEGKRIVCELKLPVVPNVDPRLFPEKLFAEYLLSKDGMSIDLSFTWIGKPANRMAESYWLTFKPESIAGIMLQKMGSLVDVLDIVPGGNMGMHAIDDYADIITNHGTVRITSLDVLVVALGSCGTVDFKNPPELSHGIHFCLFNNYWGTNFSMWNEGSQRFRFRIEWKD